METVPSGAITLLFDFEFGWKPEILEMFENIPFWGPGNSEIFENNPFWGPEILEILDLWPFKLLSDCNIWKIIHSGNLFAEEWTWESWNLVQNKHFSENGSPGPATMLTRRASKFWVKPRSPFPEISHHDPKTTGKPPSIVSWPECQCFLRSLGSYDVHRIISYRHILLFLIRRHVFYRHILLI